MTASFYPSENSSSERRVDSLESSINHSQTQVNSLPPLLPRSAWNSQVVYLRLIFRAKKALERIEQEAGVLRSEH